MTKATPWPGMLTSSLPDIISASWLGFAADHGAYKSFSKERLFWSEIPALGCRGTGRNSVGREGGDRIRITFGDSPPRSCVRCTSECPAWAQVILTTQEARIPSECVGSSPASTSDASLQ